MKKRNLQRSMLSLLAIILFSFTAVAGSYYVCSGTTFILKPSVTTFTEYEWSVNGSVVQTGAVTDYDTTFTLASAAVAEAKTASLRVKDINGCWSVAATHTIYVLPILTATIAGKENFCWDEALSGNLTASTLTGLNLAAAPGTNYTFSWTGGTGSTASGTNNNTYTISTAGGYGVSVAYTLPVNDGSKITACNGANDTHTVTVLPAPITPTVIIE